MIIKSLGALIILTALACGKAEHRVQAAPFNSKASLEFEDIRNSIFEPHCVACHAQYRSLEGVARELSAISNAVEENRMPKGRPPLHPELKAALRRWISQIKTPPAQPLEPIWNSIGPQIFEARCTVCHNPNGQAQFLNLSSRQILFDQRHRVFADGKKLIDLDDPQDSYLIQVIRDPVEPMPPISSRIPLLTAKEVDVLVEWIRLGLP